MEVLLYGLAFATIGVIVLSLYFVLKSRDPMSDRFSEQNEHDRSAASLRKSDDNPALQKLLQPFQERLKREQAKEEYTDERRNLLRSAGYYSPNAGAYLYMIRLILALMFASAMTFAMFLYGTEYITVNPNIYSSCSRSYRVFLSVTRSSFPCK